MRTAICLVALICTISWALPVNRSSEAAAACRASARFMLVLPGRVDSLLATGLDGSTLALAGKPGSRLPYIPHDALLLIGADGHIRQPQPEALPPYVMPPGLAVLPASAQLYVLADATMLTIDSRTSRTLARQDLGMQAIGAPAAITTDAAGDVFLLGQPATSWVAQAYAFRPDRHLTLKQRWHTPLGPTHAGSWVGIVGSGLLAVYTPDLHDQHGTIVLLDQMNGTLRGSYQVLMPPVASDAGRNRLYLAAAGNVYAIRLDNGSDVAVVRGEGPLVANAATGLVAFLHGNMIELVRSDNLHHVLSIAVPGGLTPTALAWNDAALMVGTGQGLSRITLEHCSGAT